MTDTGSPMYTCITCRLLVDSPQLQREHYLSDWHRYNLKRKVASLPPVSLETFLEKASAQNALMLASQSVKQQSWKCELCRKHFSSHNQLENHLTSKRHLSVVAAAKGTSPSNPDSKSSQELLTEDCDDIIEVSDPEPLEPHECLFCPTQCSDTESHLQHMYLSHGFFIPLTEYAQDVPGILKLLASLVGQQFACVYCINRCFSSVEAAQHHMRDKSHCKLNTDDTDLFCDQFSAFYDFSASYPDQEQASADDPPSESSLRFADDMGLILPSGATIGHRAFRHIYRQNLRPSLSRSVILAKPTVTSQAEYRIKLKCFRERKELAGQRSKQDMKLGIKANKFQPYFRRQC